MNFLRQWRKWIRPFILAFYIVAVLIIMPLLVIEFQLSGVEKHLQAWLIGGSFVLLAIPISFWGLTQHLIHYTQPRLQRYIIRILWMVPIYATDAWFALRFKEAAIYLDTIRECYEAYVLYNFMAFLLQFLATEYTNLEEVLEAKPDVPHVFPLCLLPNLKNGRKFIMRCKHFVLQYTVVRPITTVIALITQFAHVYHEGSFQANSAWLYLVIINSFSQGLAMYCLVLFYQGTKEELRHLKPIPKFLCIKAIVFFTFWQQVIIAGLVAVGVIRNDNTKWPEFSARDIATGLNDLIICIEMFLFAIFHYYSFSHKPYVDYALGHQDCCQSFRDMWDVSDVRDDVVDHVRTVGTTATDVMTRPLRKKPEGSQTEKTPLLNETPESPEIEVERTIGVTNNSLNTVPCTPPVHIEVHDYYEIKDSDRYTDDELQQQENNYVPHREGNINSNSSGRQDQYLRDKPLIDFASDQVCQPSGSDGNLNNSNSIKASKYTSVFPSTSSAVSLQQQLPYHHQQQQQQQKQPHSPSSYHLKQDSNLNYNSGITTPCSSSFPFSKPPGEHTTPQHQISTEDSVSTHTFESVSDITDSSINRPATGSMYNYAQFSDADTVSHTSQQSEVTAHNSG